MSDDLIFGYARYPPFQLDKPKYPQGTYIGRWLQFMDVIDPRTLFTSSSDLTASINLLKRYKDGLVDASDPIVNKKLWDAQKIKNAIIHPDTGEKILPPFRMSGFVPFGWPTVVGLCLPNHTYKSMIFWQWVNQSHNAAVNYSNRNASKETPLSRFVLGYLGAVGTSVGISVGLQFLTNNTRNVSPTLKLIIQRFIPLPAVAIASSINCVLMRYSELETGIEVYDKTGTVVGVSKVAARSALEETALTRMFLPVPLLTIPPIFMMLLERRAWFERACRKSPRLHLVINSITVIATFWLALPAAIAIFPQETQMNTSKLEKEIQANTREANLYFNKGL